MAVNFARFSVEQLRTFLINEGYDEDQVRKTRKLDLVDQVTEDGLSEKLDKMYPDEEVSGESEDFGGYEIEQDVLTGDITGERISLPKRGTPEWNEHVLNLFLPDEFVDYPVDGGSKTIKAVKCEGLRRVAELVYTVLESFPDEQGVHYPDYTIHNSGDLAKLKNPPLAWVKYKIVIDDNEGNVRKYGGCADVNVNNTDPKFLPFALTTAETKAEARALRKALGIKIYAVEELTSGDTAASVSAITTADWSKGPITDIQKKGIKNLADKLKIDVFKLINCQFDGPKEKQRVFFVEDKIRNESLDDLTNEGGLAVLGVLNAIQQNKKEKDQSLLVD